MVDYFWDGCRKPPRLEWAAMPEKMRYNWIKYGIRFEPSRVRQKPPLTPQQIKAKNTTMGEPGILHPSTSVCIILNKHHEILKDDPERLSTDFIKSMSGMKRKACKEVGD